MSLTHIPKILILFFIVLLIISEAVPVYSLPYSRNHDEMCCCFGGALLSMVAVDAFATSYAIHHIYNDNGVEFNKYFYTTVGGSSLGFLLGFILIFDQSNSDDLFQRAIAGGIVGGIIGGLLSYGIYHQSDTNSGEANIIQPKRFNFSFFLRI